VVHARRVTLLSIVVDFSLFLLKLAAGVAANSLALLADAANSLLDAFYSLGVFLGVKGAHERADQWHPFASARLEPMTTFVVALLSGIVAFEFLRTGLLGLLVGSGARVITVPILVAVLIALVAKVLLSYRAQIAGMQTGSPALLGTAADSRNDILLTLVALTGLVFAATGIPWMDDAAAIVISLYLFRSSWHIVKELVEYVHGVSAPAELERRIREVAMSVAGVRGIHLIRSHYVGSFVHVELHILVGLAASPSAVHRIAMTLQHDVELLPGVSKAFIYTEAV
jgi:cation diffusion facilitator family transporter